MKTLKVIIISSVSLFCLMMGQACSQRNLHTLNRLPEQLQELSCGQSNNVPVQLLQESELGLTTKSDIPFEQRLKNFASATVDPNDLGSITGTKTGAFPARVQLYAPLANNSLDMQNSYIEISIQDSLANTWDQDGQWIEPYRVRLESLSTGSWISSSEISGSTSGEDIVKAFDATKLGTWKFEDDFGIVEISWQTQGAELVGEVKFENKKSVGGGEPKKGYLGAFKVKPCTLQKKPTST